MIVVCVSDGYFVKLFPFICYCYLFVCFKAKTQIHYNNDHPEFNQELRVAFKV